MSFVDQVKQRAGTVAGAASGVAQNAVKQTKTLAAVGRIKIAVSTEEDKLKKAYTELGRLYYRDVEAETAPVPEEYQPWIDKISDAKAQIARLNEEITRVRTVPETPAEEPEEAVEAAVETAEDEAAEAVIEAAVEETPEEAPQVEAPVEEAPASTTEFEIFPEEPPVGTLYVDETNFDE